MDIHFLSICDQNSSKVYSVESTTDLQIYENFCTFFMLFDPMWNNFHYASLQFGNRHKFNKKNASGPHGFNFLTMMMMMMISYGIKKNREKLISLWFSYSKAAFMFCEAIELTMV